MSFPLTPGPCVLLKGTSKSVNRRFKFALEFRGGGPTAKTL